MLQELLYLEIPTLDLFWDEIISRELISLDWNDIPKANNQYNRTCMFLMANYFCSTRIIHMYAGVPGILTTTPPL